MTLLAPLSSLGRAEVIQKENFEVMMAPLVPHKRYSAPTLVQLNGGKILAAYDEWTELGEIRDVSPTVISARLSSDGGRSWAAPFVLKENTSKAGRMGPPTLLRLKNGEIGFLYGEMHAPGVYPYFFRRSSDEGKTWSAPVLVNPQKGYYVVNNHRFIQLSCGRLVIPFSFIPDLERRSEYSWEVVCHYSDDNGLTWSRGKGLVKMPKHRVGAQEPGLVELKDGSIFMIIRNAQERVYRSISRDSGDTWTAPGAIEQLIAPVSSATILRLPKSGDLAIVWNYSPKVRTPLAVAISRDEGETWGNFKYLETGYRSYAYTAFLFPRNSNQLLLCYWIHDRNLPAIGLKIRGIEIDWLYSPE